MKIGSLRLKDLPGITARVCMVHPSDADALLKMNTHNRQISQATVDRYVEEMLSGEWFPTSSGVGIDTNWRLTDGQQRLEAIRKAGIGVPLLIVTGLPPRSQEKEDRQRRRTLFDVFSLSGDCSNRLIVQTATFLAAIDDPNRSFRGVPADSRVRAALKRYAKPLEAVHLEAVGHHRGIDAVGVRAAMVKGYEVHGHKAIEFFRLLHSELHADVDDPAFRLRKALLGETTTRKRGLGFGGSYQDWSYRRALFAFNAWMRGEKIKTVREAVEVWRLELGLRAKAKAA